MRKHEETSVLNYLVYEFFKIFNSLHPKLQFTLEIEDDRLNFLYVIHNVIIIANESLMFFTN